MARQSCTNLQPQRLLSVESGVSPGVQGQPQLQSKHKYSDYNPTLKRTGQEQKKYLQKKFTVITLILKVTLAAHIFTNRYTTLLNLHKNT